jgi:hypothetical protein
MTQTSKEKAEELVKKFLQFQDQESANILAVLEGIDLENAKKSTLVCVIEIMNDAESQWNVDDRNYEQSGHYEFWTDVRNEIIKL